MPAATVEDVFVRCLSPSVTESIPARHVVLTVKSWLAQRGILSAAAADQFFAQPDTHGWATTPDFVSYWVTMVVAKFLKFAASEYAYFHRPSNEETMWLTARTAQLVKVEHLRLTFRSELHQALHSDPSLQWRWGSEVDTVSVFHALLFVLIFYQRPAVAMRVVEPVFLSIVREQEEIFTIVPQLQGYFLPHMAFQGIPFASRIAMLADQLVQRGFVFSAGFTFITPGTAPRVIEPVAMKVEEVLRRIQNVLPPTEVRIRSRIDHDDGETDESEDLSLNQYLSAIVHVCRRYYLRCRQASKKQRKNGATLLKLLPSNVMEVMKKMHKMLRFGDQYSNRFQALGIWRDILRSEGWVPLQVMDEQLSQSPNSILKDLPTKEKLDIVEALLRQHDNFQRYQVGYCSVPGSPFHGQRCARSVYGHALQNPPLYRHIICHPDCLLSPTDPRAMAGLPLYGWVALSEKPTRAFASHASIFPLFDNIPFCVVMPAEAIGAFREYEETIPMEKKYDEKLRKPELFFAEIYLRALALDGAAMVVEGEEDAASYSSSSSSSVSAQRWMHPSARSSVESSRVSLSRSSLASTQAATPAAATVATTEVYSRVQDESDARTQRWYVFPQYYVRRPPKEKARGGETVQPTAKGSGGGAAALAAVHRVAPRNSGFTLGVPKLFFTGRIAQLRARKSTDISRHDTTEDSADAAARTKPRQASREDSGERERAEGTSEEAASDGQSNAAEVDGDSDEAEAAPRCVGRRNTPREFEQPAEGGSDEASGGEEPGAALEGLATPTLLCEYVIRTSRAEATALPPVVVRGRVMDGAGEREAAGDDSVVCLSACRELSAPYRRCFPPSRVRQIFKDYEDDALMPVEEVGEAAVDNSRAERAAAAEWGRAAAASGSPPPYGKRVAKWGEVTVNAPVSAATAATARPGSQAGVLDATRDQFDGAELRTALEKFIASDQFVCVLAARVTTASGVALAGCRQGIDEVKLFAKMHALSYAKVGKAASQDYRAAVYGGGDGDSSSSAASPPPTPSPAHEGVEEAGSKVMDLELMEFRKRVSWSARDLEHVLSELHLTVSDVPLSLLTTALTRECEDRTTNYELLEFIGDAVMDFLVAADACLLSHSAYEQASRDTTNADAEKERWTPQASRVLLPQHCWIHNGVALEAEMRDSVTSVLCRNHVIERLLPPTVDRHFSSTHYSDIAYKVRADVFEAMIGAAYRSGVGLDRLRLLLRRLFSFLPAAARLAVSEDSPAAAELVAALQMCPYLLEEGALCVEKLYHYRTNELFELTPALLEGGGDGGGGGAAAAVRAEAGVNTHLVASRLPRIQAKEFATMFTTGEAYAYRRLFSFDTVRVHNRILHLFSEKSIGFMNEIFTSTIHLVLDIDKVALRSWGLLRILWDWYSSRYACPAGMFALDCSGRTMVNKEKVWKDSCHIHFPQVTVRVETWDRLVTDIRDAVVTTLNTKEARLRDTFTAHIGDFCVWLRRSTLGRQIRACGGEPRPHLWTFCDTDTLLQLSRTSRAVRQSVLEHVAYVTRSLPAMAAFAGLDSQDDVYVGDATKEEELVVVEHRPTRRRLILPLHWMEACRQEPPLPVFRPTQVWDDVIDQGLTKSKKLRLYLNDKCDIKYGVERRPLVLDTLLLHQIEDSTVNYRSPAATVGAPGAALHDAFVTYRPQRFDREAAEKTDLFCLHRARQDGVRREGRALLRDTSRAAIIPPATQPSAVLRAGDGAGEAIRPLEWDATEFGDGGQEGWVVECAHRSTLTLSSLRTCEYRAVDRKTYSTWVDCEPLCAGTTAAGEEGERKVASLLSPDGVDDRLPSFTDVYERRVSLPGQLEEGEWLTWLNFFKMRPRDYVMREDNTQTIRVWSPTWWAFDSTQRTATFYVATEPLLRLHDIDSLAAALSPPALMSDGAAAVVVGGGLERIAQLFMPQISTRNKAALRVKETLCYLLFVERSAATGAAGPGGHAATTTNARTPPVQPQSPAAAALSGPAQRDATAVSATQLAVLEVMSPTAAAPNAARKTFSLAPAVVSLAAHVTLAPPALTASLWLQRAVTLVYQSTAARTELGSVPLILCESAEVFDDVCASFRLLAARLMPAVRAAPLVLCLQDLPSLTNAVQEMAERQHQLLRHIFLVPAGDLSSEGGDSDAASRTLAQRFKAFHGVLCSALRDSIVAQRFVYVTSDAIRAEVQSALSASARVL